MIDCKFRTAQGSCRHIDEAVGDLVIIQEDACAFCIKSTKDVESRSQSYPVLNLSYSERKKRGLPVGSCPKYERPTRQSAEPKKPVDATKKPVDATKKPCCGKTKSQTVERIPVTPQPLDQPTKRCGGCGKGRAQSIERGGGGS
jgi:hypothetical protein